MSHKIKEKDWWLLFNHMSESKLKQRHEEYVDIIETNKKEYWFIQIHNTSFVKLKFEDDINDNLIEKVANWAKKRNNTSKIGISVNDSDVLELKNLLLGRASNFVDYCSLSVHPNAEEALWGIWEVFELKWSKKHFIAPLYYDIWGWLQLELGKKGEEQMPVTKQYERQLKEYCKVNNLVIQNVEYDSQMNVRYLVKKQ